MTDTKELYSERPEELHEWHAIMQCLPDWHPDVQIGSDTYSTCLDDIYWQSSNRHEKATAIPVAVYCVARTTTSPPRRRPPPTGRPASLSAIDDTSA